MAYHDLDAKAIDALGELMPRFRFLLENLSTVGEEALRDRSLTHGHSRSDAVWSSSQNTTFLYFRYVETCSTHHARMILWFQQERGNTTGSWLQRYIRQYSYCMTISTILQTAGIVKLSLSTDLLVIAGKFRCRDLLDVVIY